MKSGRDCCREKEGEEKVVSGLEIYKQAPASE